MTEITKKDISVLRKADKVSLHFQHGEDGRESFIKATKVDRDDFGDRERSVDIYLDYTLSDRNTKEAFCYVPYAQGSQWQAIVWALKPGDDVGIGWRPNNNQYTKDAGLHRDECMLYVNRGDHYFNFLVDVAVTPDNSARMIK